MGFLDNSGDIIIDAVITDRGRELLARNDGSFEIVRFALGDDEVDYSLFNPSTGSLQQDQNILNIPTFEANVNEKIALKHRLISIANPDLKFLPALQAKSSTVSLGERTDSQVGKVVEFNQITNDTRIVPSEIVDPSFIITVSNDLLFIERQTPVSITPFGTAQYIIPRTSIGANQGAAISFNIAVQSLTAQVWSTLGIGTVGSRIISTTVKCEGTLSGLSEEVSITINEEFQR